MVLKITVTPYGYEPRVMSNEDQLKSNSEQILVCLHQLKKQRDEIAALIRQQEDERRDLKLNIDRYRYKIEIVRHIFNFWKICYRLLVKMTFGTLFWIFFVFICGTSIL